MARRSPARFLAPLALLAAVAAVALVVSTTTGDEEPATSAPAGAERGAETSTGARTSTTSGAKPSSNAKTYRVKTGDTLGMIAEQTGVSIADLQELNPGVDPQSLRVGQRLKLVR